MNLPDEIINIDVLIIGGGIAGLSSAIAIKEESKDVDILVVEKATSGWAGKVNKGGGVISYVDKDSSPDIMVENHVKKIGCYLNDQELLTEYANSSASILDRFESWGPKFLRDKEGKVIKMPMGSNGWVISHIELDICLKLLKTAKSHNVKFMNKVSIVDLIKDNDRIVGAIGFSLLNGNFYIIKAEATIIATGSQNYRIMPMWNCARGDGIASAYRAGAIMRNAEFGNFVNMVLADNNEIEMFSELYMYNTKGEFISDKYVQGLQPDINVNHVIGWYKETLDGNGPIYTDRSKNEFVNVINDNLNAAMKSRKIFNKFWSTLMMKKTAYLKDPKNNLQEIKAGFIGELSCIKVDHDMKTSLECLYAIGDSSYSGSAWSGAVPSPPGRVRGSGIMNALFSAVKVAPALVKDLTNLSSSKKLDTDMIFRIKSRLFEPLNRNDGIKPIEIVKRIQNLLTPLKYSIYKSEDRLNEAIKLISEIKADIPMLKAKDMHDLSACNEVNSMIICAELFYRSSLERKESRGWFVREDYQNIDNKNFLNWICLKDNNGKMETFLEKIPLEKYKYKS